MGNQKKRYFNFFSSRKYLLIYIINFLILINIKDSKGIKIKSFFFSGWDDKKVQDNNAPEPNKSNPIQPAGQDTSGAIPASPVSTSTNIGSNPTAINTGSTSTITNTSLTPITTNTGSTPIPNNNNGSPLPGLPPFIPPPAPSNNQNTISHSQNEVLDPSKHLEIEQAKSITECCHKAIYGTSKNKSDITESITEAASNVKPGDTVTLKSIIETPISVDNSNKPNFITNQVQHAIPSPIGNSSISNLGVSNIISFPNGATFLPLVLDATSGQYGIEFKTMDLLIKGKDEKVKPFDMLIPFVSEHGKIKFVTRRRLRQLVKSGLSKGLEASNEKLDDEKLLITDPNKEEVNQNNDDKNEDNKGNDEEKDKKDDKKDDEKEDKRDDGKKDEKTNHITSTIEEAASGAKSLLQEAETILTGGSLFETSSNKSKISTDKKEVEDEDKSQVSEEEEEEEEGDEDSLLSNSNSKNSSELSSSGENSDIEDSSIQSTEEGKEEEDD
ncbi:hypothetical protein ACR3K2_37060 [Cryptosporidium serpentis]